MYALIGLLAGCGTDVQTPTAPRHDPSTAWEALLGRIVTPDGLVRYDVLRANQDPLADFVGWIAIHGPETDGFRLLDDNRRLAWHINAYNALALWGVLQASASGPLIHSVSDVKGFFWLQDFGVDGERLSLHTYETRDILPTYQEPLTHAALNCASRSCPPLRKELYTAANIQNEVEDQMRAWIATPDTTRAAVSWDASSAQFVFSPIFDWYARDFRDWANAATPCDAVRAYARDPIASLLAAHPDCPHRFYAYDWALNAAPP